MFPLLDEKDKRGIAPLVNLLPTQGRLTPLQRSNCAPVFSRSRYRGLFGPRGSSGNRAALEGPAHGGTSRKRQTSSRERASGTQPRRGHPGAVDKTERWTTLNARAARGVELRGLEPLTPWLPAKCSTN